VAFTAIVVTRNSAREVPGLIESFERHLPATCGLLFVDNASTDGTVEAIRRSSSRASVMVLAGNVGFGPANNAGVRAARSEVVVLLNPDTLIVDQSLDSLAEVAARERALFAPRLLNHDGSVQISARAPLASWEAGLISVWPGGLMPTRLRMRCEPWRYERRLAAGWLSAACLVARRELLLEFGPFDERLVMYGEDCDLCLRAWRARVPSIAASDIARVVHLGGRSASQTFTDSGMQRKIEARWWVVHERLGRLRGLCDLWIQAVGHALRWTARTIGGRDTEVNSAWLRGFARAVRAGRPPRPQALTSAGPSSEPARDGAGAAGWA
jgi:GT2 family glycosyltransferase